MNSISDKYTEQDFLAVMQVNHLWFFNYPHIYICIPFVFMSKCSELTHNKVISWCLFIPCHHRQSECQLYSNMTIWSRSFYTLGKTLCDFADVNFVWQESLILMGLIDVEALRVGVQIKDKDAGDVSRFLNRILGLSVAKQNCVSNKRGELKDSHLVSCYKLLLTIGTEIVSLFFISLVF